MSEAIYVLYNYFSDEKLYFLVNNNETIELKENELEKFSKILIDRFGPLPNETIELFKSVKLKWLASSLGFKKIILKKSKCISIFNEDYIKNITELALANLLKRIGKIKGLAIKEKNNKNGKKFMVIIDNVDSVSKATKLLKEILINLDE